jgi:hypothetical protein
VTRAAGVASGIVSVAVILLGLGCGSARGTYREARASSEDSLRSSRDESVSRRSGVDLGTASDSSGSSYGYGGSVEIDASAVVSEMPGDVTIASTGYGATGSGSSAPEPETPPRELERELYAQAQTSPTTTPEATATDAVDTSGELLIYTALFHVAVYDVAVSQAAIAESARTVGGFVYQQSDDRIVVRVPAPHFRAFIETVEGAGDVLHRQIDAQDVGEEFRDVEIRIRNLEAVRDRIADLLERGLSVEQVLVVERELERVTSELERMRGRQRYLADHIAYSTITVVFQPAPREDLDQPDVFQLPFSWLDSLGLSNLLNLR